ncbi:MAG: DUF5009 domain-containing protein, partial [Gillisia sp.]
FSLKKYETKGESAFLKKLFTRTLLIFLIGLFLNGFPFVYRDALQGWQVMNFADIRIMGVLQRIALCYCIGGLLIRYLSTKPLLVVSTGLLLIYWWLMYHFGDAGDPYSLKGNAELKFDLVFFNPKNLYHGYAIPFDPEGLLSTIPAIVNVIGGYLAGMFIQKSGNNFNTVWKLALGGLVLLGVALLWSPLFPINKPIWTSSYVLYTIGWDTLLLGALIFVTEVINFKKGAYFFEVFGRNPLFIYILSGVIIEIISLIHIGGESLKKLIYEEVFLSWLSALNASLLFAFCYMLLLWLIALWMDKRSIYIKV